MRSVSRFITVPIRPFISIPSSFVTIAIISISVTFSWSFVPRSNFISRSFFITWSYFVASFIISKSFITRLIIIFIFWAISRSIFFYLLIFVISSRIVSKSIFKFRFFNFSILFSWPIRSSGSVTSNGRPPIILFFVILPSLVGMISLWSFISRSRSFVRSTVFVIFLYGIISRPRRTALVSIILKRELNLKSVIIILRIG